MKSNAKSAFGRRSSRQWWLGALVGVAAFAFGFGGLRQYEVEHGMQPDVVSLVYHTLQLFILHAPHLEYAAPWRLHVGRLLAATLFFAAASKAFLKVFRDELLLLRLWLPWCRGHVVVCGLGDLGLRLALDGCQRRKFVVAIEKYPALGALEQARASSVLVLEGDARDPAQLRQARVARADFLVAACEDDQTNIAIAALAGRFVWPMEKRATPLVCRLLIRDPKLRALVSDESLFPHTGTSYRVNFNDLDLEDTAARQALRRYPLDFKPIHKDDETIIHLVVIGFGQIGQSLARHAARIGHFANEVGKRQKRIRITVVDKDSSAGWNDFLSRYNKLQQVCEVKFASHVLGDAAFFDEMDKVCPAAGALDALVTYAICIENADQINLQLGLKLSRMIIERPAQVLIHQTSQGGFAALFPQEGRGTGLGEHIHPFGMAEDVFNWEVLLHESEDALAQALHKNYQERRAAEGVPDKNNPAWDKLPEDLKESNRQAADHIAVKLRALGLHEEPLTKEKQRIERIEGEDLLLLAKMEHARWCAERWLAGWELGPTRDRPNKTHDSLVSWEQLSPEKQQHHREQVSVLPEALSRIKRGIYR